MIEQATVPSVAIQLPANFTPHHEDVVIRYLSGQLRGPDDWRLAIEAFNLLDDSVIENFGQVYNFRTFYRQFVDERFSEAYLQALLNLANIRQQSPSLWASYARQIVQAFIQLGWQDDEQTTTRLCLSYLLYWWNAFARGYAFEAEVFQDLQRWGVDFQAHDLLNRHQRFSPSDLTVIGQAGDIKTSTYFLHLSSSISHDFYIVRFWDHGQLYTIVVMLQSASWDKINGDTVDGHLSSVLQQLPRPVRIRSDNHEFVVIAYDEWKRRILRIQGKA